MKTPTGYRNIEDIRAGDKVLSYNETTKRLEVQTVAQTFIRKTDRIYTLVYDTGTKLETTATHPFYIEGKGWVKAADLHVGDDSLLAGEISPLDIYGGARLQNVSYRQSKQGVIVGITVEDRHETVYNFEVNETHTYLVGDADVVVHNAEKYNLDSFSDADDGGFISGLCSGDSNVPDCVAKQVYIKKLRKEQAQKLYEAGKDNNPGIADTQYLQDLFETGIVSDATDLNEKLEDILDANQGDGRGVLSNLLNPLFEFAIDSGDAGFTEDFKDPHESSSRQVGHFLTAVGMADSVMGDDAAIRLIISHEQVADNDTSVNKAVATWNVSDQDIQAFKDAARMVTEDGGNLQRGMAHLESQIRVDPAMEGNSHQDLKLSLAGYWMGKAIKSGQFKTGAEVSKWIKKELQVKE